MSSQLLEKSTIRFSVEKYHSLYELGLIPEKTELLDGVIIEKMTKNPIHTALVNRTFTYFLATGSGSFQIRKEDPITLSDSEPEPDISFVDFRDDAYSTTHPTWVHLVIEVPNTSLALDREKAYIYAKGNIPEYWIINLIDMVVEVYRDPAGQEYKSRKIYAKNEVIAALFSSKIQFKLSDFV